MKVNFNGLRIALARDYNGVVDALKYREEKLSEQTRDSLTKLGDTIAVVLCIYDPDREDCDDLSEKVKLKELPESEDV